MDRIRTRNKTNPTRAAAYTTTPGTVQKPRER